MPMSAKYSMTLDCSLYNAKQKIKIKKQTDNNRIGFLSCNAIVGIAERMSIPKHTGIKMIKKT